MAVHLEDLVVGNLYTRVDLARLWGYRGHQAIARGVVTPSGGGTIILFVTQEKQASLTQYRDYINGDHLHWEGEKGRGSDRRIARSPQTGEEVHLFFREIHHTPFRYHGRIFITEFNERAERPSRFVFKLEHDLGPEDDIESAEQALAALPTTERDAVVRARVGQGRFREDLFAYWKGCAVTGVTRPELLRASHIKPWRTSTNEERLSQFNGLLLLPQYDHLFDRGFITFEESGKIAISPAVRSLSTDSLGIVSSARLKAVEREHLPFLEYHHSQVFLDSVDE